MIKKLSLKAENRDIFGKKMREGAALKKTDMLPAILYGRGQENKSLFVSFAEFSKVWKEAGESTIIELDAGGEKKNVLIYDVDLDPIKNNPRHVDFYAVDMTKTISTPVPLEFEGVAPAVKNLGGILVKVMHEIEIEALPKDLPSEIKVDISVLEKFGDKIIAADLKMPEGVNMLGHIEDVVALVEEMREDAVPEGEEKTIADIEVVGAKDKEKEETGEKEGGAEVSEKKE